jgi:hypothetical protein
MNNEIYSLFQEEISKLNKRVKDLEKVVCELDLDRLEMDATSNPRGWKRSVKGKRHQLWIALTQIELTNPEQLPKNFNIENFINNYPIIEESNVRHIVEEVLLLAL